MYRAALTYHPHIGTFRGARGAWRVVACWSDRRTPMQPRVVRTHVEQPELWMDVPRHLHIHTFVNPTKLLREVLAQRTAS